MFMIEGKGRPINPCTSNTEEKKDWDRIFLEYPEACTSVIACFNLIKKIVAINKTIATKTETSEDTIREAGDEAKYASEVYKEQLFNLNNILQDVEHQLDITLPSQE